jgi:serine/threonine-protein phosphatase 2B regulatory subunit
MEVAHVQRTKYRLKRVQSEKMIEMKDPKTSKEQIIKLKVYQQLNMIESHTRSGSHESPQNDTSQKSVMDVPVFLNQVYFGLFFVEPF